MKNTNKNTAKLLVLALTLALFGSFYGCSENSSNILGVSHNTSSSLPNNPDKEKNDVIWSSNGFDVITTEGYGENCVDYYFEGYRLPNDVNLEFDVDTPAEKLGYYVNIEVTINEKLIKEYKIKPSTVIGHHQYFVNLSGIAPGSNIPKLCVKGTLFTDALNAPETGMKVRNIKMFEK